MALTKRVSRFGNSAGVTIPRAVLAQLGWDIGSEVELQVEAGRLVVQTHETAPPQRTRRVERREGAETV